MSVQFTNNAATTLGASVLEDATAFNVTSSSGFPTNLGSGDYFYVTLGDLILKITGVSGITWTRDTDFNGDALTSGAAIELRMTAEVLEDVRAEASTELTSHTNATSSHIDWTTDQGETDIDTGNYTDTTYSTASNTTPGLVKVEDAIAQTVVANNVSTTTGRTYGIQLNDNDQMVVNVPWEDTGEDNALNTAITTSVQSWSATQTFQGITETQSDENSTFTPVLTDGTVYSCTGTMTISMPTATAGKSFTIIHATADDITWSGTIKWSGGAAPTAVVDAIEIYTFLSDGSHWYGMQAGTGFA